MTIRVRSQKGPHAIRSVWLRKHAQTMLDSLERSEHELSVLLTDDVSIARINHQYRGLDRSTDVLSFAMMEGECSQVCPSLLGDVVISVPAAVRQATEEGVTAEHEVLRLLAHGVLHLVGHDHQTAAASRRMRAQTDKLIALCEGR